LRDAESSGIVRRMDTIDYKMASFIAKGGSAHQAKARGELQMWWGTRLKVSGKAVIASLIEKGLAEDFTVEVDGTTRHRIRLTKAGFAAVRAEREVQKAAKSSKAALGAGTESA